MPDRTDLVYLCEESLEGTLCCVYESYTRREVPFDILPEGTPTLYPSRPVVSDEAHAARVWRSLLKLDPEAAAWVRDGWCSSTPTARVSWAISRTPTWGSFSSSFGSSAMRRTL